MFSSVPCYDGLYVSMQFLHDGSNLCPRMFVRPQSERIRAVLCYDGLYVKMQF